MELVYLWIEEYKNIKNQGFNFSPRFRCEFKPKFKENSDEMDYEESKLIIKENENYVNIFPENINVTAIVGKNGAGKSSVVEFIFKKIYNLDKEKENDKFLLVFFNKNEKQFVFKFNTFNKKKDDWLENNVELKNMSNISKVIEENFNELMYGILIDFSLIQSNIENEKNEGKKKNYKKNYSIEPSSPFFNNVQAINTKKIIPGTFDLHMKLYATIYSLFVNEEFFKNSDFVTFDSLEIKGKSKRDLKEEIKEMIEDKVYKGYIEENIEENNENKKKYSINYEKLKKDLIKKLIEKDKFNKDTVLKIQDIKKQDYFLDYLYLLFYLFNIEISNEKLKFSELSNGQKTMILYFGIILYLYKFYIEGKKKVINLIIDECESYLHPEWQRKFLYNLVLFLKTNIKLPVNLIILTHSPFILSDLPKENIIFMKDGKNVSDEVDIETFGANIHTLLSHAFFMEDGLMGEYASEKINDVINYLNDEESDIKNDEEAQKIINLIGEPIIRNELQRRLDSKKLKKINEIDKIKEEIKILKEKLKDLENEKNNNN